MSAPLSECRLVGDHIRRSSTLIDIGGADLVNEVEYAAHRQAYHDLSRY
jgi:hypothetical protein